MRPACGGDTSTAVLAFRPAAIAAAGTYYRNEDAMDIEDLEYEEEELEMDEVLERITFYSFDEAKKKLNAGEECVPFTVVVEGEQMFVENHPADDVETCRAQAVSTIKSASTFASHYSFCYDGFLMTDDGQLDAIIVECASREMDQAYAIALLYRVKNGKPAYEEQPAFVDYVETAFDKKAVAQAIKDEQAKAQGEADFAEHVE